MFDIGEPEIQAVADTIRKGNLTRFQGGTDGYLARVERAMMEKWGMKHVLLVNSGTSALISALVALGIGKGDEVLLSAYTWISTPLAPMLLGALPKLVEINETLTMDPKDLEKKITAKTKAIMVIHMANLPCDMDAIMAIANAHHIPVVEDACQAVGGMYKGRRLATIGTIGCFSFNNYKNISCGEGGAILTNDDVLYDRARLWHDAGTFVQKYDAPVKIPMFAGQDYRASEIDGAILWAQLPRLDPGLQGLRDHVRALKEFFASPSCGSALAPHNDPASQANLAVQFKTESDCESFHAKHPEMDSIYHTAGRHIFTNWEPLVEKRAYRDDANPFLTSEGRKCHYDASAAPRTLDILKRTMYVTPGWNQPMDEMLKWFGERF